MLMTILGIGNVYCQEVRGIETKRVIYQGEKYVIGKNTYYTHYGWELKNRNSIPVSVEITLNYKGENGIEIVTTKDVVLSSGETYIFKPAGYHFQVLLGYLTPDENRIINNYYVTYRAFKLE